MKLLIIENDRDIVSFLKERFYEKSISIDHTYNIVDGLRMAKNTDYDLVILSHPAGVKPVCSICKEIRKQSHHTRKNVPIIIISHEDDIGYKIKCFDSGADDYILKPFFFDELFARICAILRRPSIIHDEKFCIDDLELDISTQKLTRGNKAVYLTRKEYAIVEYLMRHVKSVVSRTDIVEHVWDIHANPFSNMIEMHMVNLRKKINIPGKKPLLHCVIGRGYKIDVEK